MRGFFRVFATLNTLHLILTLVSVGPSQDHNAPCQSNAFCQIIAALEPFSLVTVLIDPYVHGADPAFQLLIYELP